MQTFSCALQTVTIEGEAPGQAVVLTFGTEGDDYAICTVAVGEAVARFHRNGVLIDIAYPQPAEAPPPEADAEAATAKSSSKSSSKKEPANG